MEGGGGTGDGGRGPSPSSASQASGGGGGRYGFVPRERPRIPPPPPPPPLPPGPAAPPQAAAAAMAEDASAASAPSQQPTTNVAVCVRVRPLLPAERVNRCQKCVRVRDSNKSVVVGSSRALSFDHVFDEGASQEDVYENAVKGLVEGCFLGYNATVFAYGQTGSGKSYTMGSLGDLDSYPEECKGIIPRVIRDLFVYMEQQKQRQEEEEQQASQEGGAAPPVKVSFSLKVGYVEIYNEEVRDLLLLPSSSGSTPSSAMGGAGARGGLAARGGGGGGSSITIREDAKGRIIMAGATEEAVSSMEDVTALLARGSAARTTSNTLMNESSSRSHAIFTLILDKTLVLAKREAVCVRAKFHLVDLAGSERAKRTGASGTRLKESININQGLLTLGKVISALSAVEGGGKDVSELGHVPYRESKLTRLLQDSLGGNARTVMIACVSPADIDLQESLNTIKYSNRARSIENKPVINFGPKASQDDDDDDEEEGEALVAARSQLQALQLELLKVHQQASSASSAALEKKQEEVEVLCNRLGEVTRRVVHLGRDVRRMRKTAAQLATTEGEEAGDMVSALSSGLSSVEEGLEAVRRVAASDDGAYAVPLLAQVTELEMALCSRNEELDSLKRDLQEKEDDLARDEQIFASKMKELKKCHAQIREYQGALQRLSKQLEEEQQQRQRPRRSDSGAAPGMRRRQSSGGEAEGEGEEEGAARGRRRSREDSKEEDDDEEEEGDEEEGEEEGGAAKVAELHAAKERAEKEKEALLAEAEARSQETDEYRRKTERQIQTLEVNIRLKEELIRSLAHSEKEAEQLVRKYEDRVQGLEEETETLRASLDEIRRELTDVSHESRALVEQKRRQEATFQAALRKAESELSSLKQQKEEQNRVNKLRKRSDERMAMLEMEVRRMSTERESLIRRLKEEEKKERGKAEALAKHVQALKQQASEHVRRIRELEARNTHLHRSLASRESARSTTPHSGRRPSSTGGETLRSARAAASSRLPPPSPRPQAVDEAEPPPSSSSRRRRPMPQQQPSKRGEQQEEEEGDEQEEEEDEEDVASVIQWFRGRWSSLTAGVQAQRQATRHLERRRAAEAERAELVSEKRRLVEKRSEASKRVHEEAAGLARGIEMLNSVLEDKVKEYQARTAEDRAGAGKLAESIRGSRAEMQELSQRLRSLEERMGRGQMLDEEEERRLDEVADSIEALEEELRYLDAQVERLTASLPPDQAKALLMQSTTTTPAAEQEGDEDSRSRGQQQQAWQQQDAEAFLAQLMQLSPAAARSLLQEACRELFELHHKADKESTEVALLQMRLEQKTAVCADFAKALHKTKAEFGRRQSRLQRESEDKIQYLLRQLRDYERSSSSSSAAAPPADNDGPASPASQRSTQDGGGSGQLQKQLLEEQRRGRELQALNLKLLRELQSAQQALANAAAHARGGRKGPGGAVVVRLPSKSLIEIEPPVVQQQPAAAAEPASDGPEEEEQD